MRAIGSMSSGLKRALTAVAVAAGVLTTGALVAAPAEADDGWRGHRHHHHWHHKHHRHHPHYGGRAYFSYGPPAYYYAPPPRVYYAPPPVYYAPPPVYYAPPSSLSLGLNFPLR